MASYRFDLFICHASEDKDALVSPLAAALVAAGLRVWYDEFSLRLGDNLRLSIDKGLVHSKYGLIVLSRAFFKKQWPQWELDGLLQRQLEGAKVILPVWHGVSASDIKHHSLSLANVKGVGTDSGLGTVIDQILDVVVSHSPKRRPPKTNLPLPGAATPSAPVPIIRFATPCRQVEHYHIDFADALETGNASAEAILRSNPQLLFYASRRGASVIRGGFDLDGCATFDAVQLSHGQTIGAGLITLAPVSEPPFGESGAWSTSFATAVGRIAVSKRWIKNNRGRFHRLLLDAFRSGERSPEDPDYMLSRLKVDDERLIRPEFIILSGRRASINENGRRSFHESFEGTTLVSYDSILHGFAKTPLRVELGMPVVIKTVLIEPGVDLFFSIKDWRLDEVFHALQQCLNGVPSDTTLELSAIRLSLCRKYEQGTTLPDIALFLNGSDSCAEHSDHSDHWSQWIYSKPDGFRTYTFGDELSFRCRSRRLLAPEMLDFAITAVIYRDSRQQLGARTGDRDVDLMW